MDNFRNDELCAGKKTSLGGDVEGEALESFYAIYKQGLQPFTVVLRV